MARRWPATERLRELAEQVIQQYLQECIRYDSVYQNAKYTVMEMLTKRRHPDHLKVSGFCISHEQQALADQSCCDLAGGVAMLHGCFLPSYVFFFAEGAGGGGALRLRWPPLRLPPNISQ